MRYYGIYVSDLSRPTDQLVTRRVCRQAAERIARRLNVVAMRGWREGTRQPPLAYVLRDGDAFGARRKVLPVVEKTP